MKTKLAFVGLYGEPSSKGATEWFVCADDDCKRVGKGKAAFDLAVKAVQSLASDGVPAGKNRRGVRQWMLELAVEFTRIREFEKRLTPKQRAKIDKLDAEIDKVFRSRVHHGAPRSVR